MSASPYRAFIQPFIFSIKELLDCCIAHCPHCLFTASAVKWGTAQSVLPCRSGDLTVNGCCKLMMVPNSTGSSGNPSHPSHGYKGFRDRLLIVQMESIHINSLSPSTVTNTKKIRDSKRFILRRFKDILDQR